MKFLKRLFKLKPPVLSADLQQLLSNANDTVRRYLEDGKPVPVFAVAMGDDGALAHYLADAFDDPRDAFAGLLQTLLPLARSHAIRANVLVTPMVDDGDTATVFDLESRDGQRVLAILPYRRETAGVAFEAMELQHAVPKLFVA